VLGAYAVPAIVVWALLGLGLGALGLLLPGSRGIALAAAAAYGGYYGSIELSGRRGLPPPGRRWQVPQTMLIDASPRRRVLVWGTLLGPGFATRNPFAGFGLLPLVLAAMPGIGPGVALGAMVGLAHGAARGASLVRDVRELSPAPPVAVAVPAVAVPAVAVPAAGSLAAVPAVAVPGVAVPAGGAGPAGARGQEPPTHLDMVLRTIYWRRFDGAALLAVAATGAAACLTYFA
jgi:hypothetical protein